MEKDPLHKERECLLSKGRMASVRRANKMDPRLSMVVRSCGEKVRIWEGIRFRQGDLFPLIKSSLDKIVRIP